MTNTVLNSNFIYWKRPEIDSFEFKNDPLPTVKEVTFLAGDFSGVGPRKLEISSEKYIVYRPYPGGWNNVRMSFETVCALAYLTNRTLVLEPELQHYLLHKKSNVLDFFDLPKGIKTIAFEEFCKQFNVLTYDDIPKISFNVATPGVETWAFTYLNLLSLEGADLETNVLNSYGFDKEENKKVYDLSKYIDDKILFFDKTLLGNFYSVLYTKRFKEMIRYIAKDVHYRESIYLEAAKAIDFLGDQDYYAVHVRRGDFNLDYMWTKDRVCIPVSKMIENIAELVPEGAKLYISTDETDLSFFDEFAQRNQVYFFKDVKDLMNTEDPNLAVMYEQLICSRAKKFIGSELSTFSTYMYRLRRYMADLEDQNYYVTNQQGGLLNLEWTGVWPKEYPEGSDLSD